MTLINPTCCCSGCSVAFCVFLDEASSEQEPAYFDAIRCALNEEILHPFLSPAETGLGDRRRCGAEIFVNLEDDDPGEEPTTPADCVGHVLDPIVYTASTGTDLAPGLLANIQNRFGYTQWARSDGTIVNNPHPHKIVLVCDDSGSTNPVDLQLTWESLYKHYYDRGYSNQTLLNEKFQYGYRSACIDSKDQNAGRPSPDNGRTLLGISLGGTTMTASIEHIPLNETWQTLALYMNQWVLAYT